MKKRYWLILILLGYVFTSSAFAESDVYQNYKVNDASAWDLQEMKFKRHEWSLKKEYHRIEKLCFKNSCEINIGDMFVFFGPPGSFLIRHGTDGRNKIIFPSEQIVDGKTFLQFVVDVPVKSSLYLGYYNPEKETGNPKETVDKDYISLYYRPVDEAIAKANLSSEEFLQYMKEKNRKMNSQIRKGSIIVLEPSKAMWFFSMLSFVVFGITFAVLYHKSSNSIYNPSFKNKQQKNSMRFLWTLGKKKFFCIHCGNPLQIKGKFECPAGHIPNKDRYIFKGCYKDDYQFQSISCDHCGRAINLDEDNYNENEILNRGKDFISVKGRLASTSLLFCSLAFAASFIYLVLINCIYYLPDCWYSRVLLDASIESYIRLHGFFNYCFYINPSPMMAAALFIGVVIAYFCTQKIKEVLIENPYR